jgi:hypothetical protein
MINVVLLYLLYFGIGWIPYSKLSQNKFTNNPAKALGESFLIGILFVIFAVNLVQFININIKPYHLIIGMSLISLSSLLLFLKSQTYKSPDFSNLKIVPYWQLLAWLFVFVHLYFIIIQNELLPLTPWDAWVGWIAKAKIWVFHGLNESLVNKGDWLLNDANFTNPTAHYPDGLPLLYYVNSGLFGWNESALNGIYPALFISILLSMYGNIKSNTNQALAWLAVILMVSIPFINVHVTLAGYADIWVAGYLFVVLITANNFLDTKSIQTLILLVVYSLGLVMFKLESWIWLIGVYSILLFALMTTKSRVIGSIVFLISFIIWWFIDGFGFQTPLGEVFIQPNLIKVPLMGTYELNFTNTSKAWLESLFLSYNWRLLWFSLPFIIFYSFKIKNKSRIILPATFLFYSCLFLFILFYMTGASVWANDFTSSNRIVLHIVPIYIYYIVSVIYQWQKQQNPD